MDTEPNHNIILNHHWAESQTFIWNPILIFSQVFDEGTIYDQQLTCYVGINTNDLQ